MLPPQFDGEGPATRVVSDDTEIGHHPVLPEKAVVDAGEPAATGRVGEIGITHYISGIVDPIACRIVTTQCAEIHQPRIGILVPEEGTGDEIACPIRLAYYLTSVVEGIGNPTGATEGPDVNHPGILLPKEWIDAWSIRPSARSVVRVCHETCVGYARYLAVLVHKSSPSIRATQGTKVLHPRFLIPQERPRLCSAAKTEDPIEKGVLLRKETSTRTSRYCEKRSASGMAGCNT